MRVSELPQQTRVKGAERLQMAFNGLFADQDGGALTTSTKADKQDGGTRSSLTASTTTRMSMQSAKTPSSALRRNAQVSSSYDRSIQPSDSFASPIRGGRTSGYGSRSPTLGTGYAKRHTHRAVYTAVGVSTAPYASTTSSTVKATNAGQRTSSPMASPVRQRRQPQPVKPSPNKAGAPVGATTSAVIAALAMDAALPDLDATAMALLETIMGTSLDATALQQQQQQQKGPAAALPDAQQECRSPLAPVTTKPAPLQQQPVAMQPLATTPAARGRVSATSGLPGDAKSQVLTQQLLQQHQQQFTQAPHNNNNAHAGVASPFDHAPAMPTPPPPVAAPVPGPAQQPGSLAPQAAAQPWPMRPDSWVGGPGAAAGAELNAPAVHQHSQLSTQQSKVSSHQAHVTMAQPQHQQMSGAAVASPGPFVFVGGVAGAGSGAPGMKVQQQAVPVAGQTQTTAALALQQQQQAAPQLLQPGAVERVLPAARPHPSPQQQAPAAVDREAGGAAGVPVVNPAVEVEEGPSGPRFAHHNNSGSDSETPTRPASQRAANAQHMGTAAAATGAAGGPCAPVSPGCRTLLKRMCRSQGHNGTQSNKVMRAPNKEEGRRPTTYAELQAASKVQSPAEAPLSPGKQQHQPEPQPQPTAANPAAQLPPTQPSAPSVACSNTPRSSLTSNAGTSCRELAAAAAAYARISTGRFQSGAASIAHTLSERRPSAPTNMLAQQPLTTRKPAPGEASEAKNTVAQWRQENGTARRRLFGGLLACFGCGGGEQSSPPAQGMSEGGPDLQRGVASASATPQTLTMPPPALTEVHLAQPPAPPVPTPSLPPQQQQLPAQQQQSAVVAVAKALALSPGSAAAAAKSDSRLLSLLRAELATTPEEPPSAAAGAAPGAPVTIQEHPREGDAEGCTSPIKPAAFENGNKEPALQQWPSQQQQQLPPAKVDEDPAHTDTSHGAAPSTAAGKIQSALPTPGATQPPAAPSFGQQQPQQQPGQGVNGGITHVVPGGVALHNTTLSPQLLSHEDGDSVLRGSVDTNTTNLTSPIATRSHAVAPQRAASGLRPVAGTATAGAGSAAGPQPGAAGAGLAAIGGSAGNMDAAAILSYCSSSSIMRARMLMAASEASSAKTLQHQQLPRNNQQPHSFCPSEPVQLHPQQQSPALPASVREQRYPTDPRDGASPRFPTAGFEAMPTYQQQPPQLRPEGPNFGPVFNAMPPPRSNRKRGRTTNAYGCGLSQLDARKLAALPLEEMLEQIQAAIYAEDLANGRVQNTSGGGMSDDGSILPMPPMMGGKGRITSMRRRKSTAGGRSGGTSAAGTSRGGRGSDGGIRTVPSIGAVQTTMTKAGPGGAGTGRRRRRVKASGAGHKQAPAPGATNPLGGLAAPISPGRRGADREVNSSQPVWRHGGRALAFNGLGFGGASSGSTSPRAGVDTSFSRQPPYKKAQLCGASTSGGGNSPMRLRLSTQHLQPLAAGSSGGSVAAAGAGSKTPTGQVALGCVMSAFTTAHAARRFMDADDAAVALRSSQGLHSSSKLFQSAAKPGPQARFVLGMTTATFMAAGPAASPFAPAPDAGIIAAQPVPAPAGANGKAAGTGAGPVTSSLNISDLLSRFNSDGTGTGSLKSATLHGADGLAIVSNVTAGAAAPDSLLLSELLPFTATNGASSGTSLRSAAAAAVPAAAKVPAVVPVMNVQAFPQATAPAAGHPNPAKQAQLVNSIIGGSGGGSEAKQVPSKPRIVSVSLTELLLRAEQQQQQLQRSAERQEGPVSAAGTEGGATVAVAAASTGEADAVQRFEPGASVENSQGGVEGSLVPKEPKEAAAASAPSSRRPSGLEAAAALPVAPASGNTTKLLALTDDTAEDCIEGAGETKAGGSTPLAAGAKAAEAGAEAPDASSPTTGAQPPSGAQAPEAMVRAGARYLELLQAQAPNSGRTAAPLSHYAMPIRSRAASAAGESIGCMDAGTRLLTGARALAGGNSGGGAMRQSTGSYAQIAILRQVSAPQVMRNADSSGGNGSSNNVDNGGMSFLEGGGCHVPNVMDAGSGNNSPVNAALARPGSPGCSSVLAHLPSTVKAVGSVPSVSEAEVESAGKKLLEDTADSGGGTGEGQGHGSAPQQPVDVVAPAVSDEAVAPCTVEPESSAQMSNDGGLWLAKEDSSQETGRMSPRLVDLPETPRRSLGTPGADWRCVPLEAYEQSLGDYDAYLAVPSDDE